MAKTIGIISIKGGVGKTSVVSGLAAVMANEFGKKVLVVDANFSAPNLALHYGIIKPDTTLHHVLNNHANMEDALYETEHGFHIVPGALVYKKVNPFKLKNKISSLKKHYDVIILDSSPTLNEEILATMVASDELFVVSTPDHVTLSTTLRAVKLAKQKQTPIKGIILNKVYKKDFELSIGEIEQAADTHVLAVLPHDVSVMEALSKEMPAPLHKNTESAYEFKKLAAAMMGENYKDPRIKSRVKRLFKKYSQEEINRSVFMEEGQN